MISVKFLWYDLWVGFYWDRKERVLYFCPLPCLVFIFRLRYKNERNADIEAKKRWEEASIKEEVDAINSLMKKQ